MDRLTVRDIDVKNKRVLVRVDFNVPLGTDGRITDDGRIRAAIPTIDYLVENGAKVIIMSHMGRPDGKVVPSLSLRVTADRLSELMRHPVQFVNECVGQKVEEVVSGLNDGDILVLENLRFHAEEEENAPVFAEKLARLGEVFVDDAFGTAHRAHASIVGVTKFLPAVAGLLLEKELVSLGHILEKPARPFCVLFGGAKIADKVKLLENVMDKVDTILVGGGMAATFLKADNYEVGKSIVDEKIDLAAKLMAKAKKYNIKFVLPKDVVVTGDLTPDARGICVPVDKIPPLGRVVDIGLLTINLFTKELERAKTVFWNGPMGIYEMPQFAEGTKTMADVISRLHATTIIGGGSTAEIVDELKLADKMSFVSTGGGSSMLFLSGEKLPGVEALLKKNEKAAV
ncbi:phosphoglycerate kinase [Dehalogenimonas etheniformans]|uniref:Phosphoglycerate kinase n=1 Tax=Dehalogenimonas etheniformans TaxID=1536648 RepID=A0A2P5P9G9_9CHLR|nr:phosphoglycerate kinase [Dehalogenimonas etheniformans]PPD58953.1 phosphoglycerate kinase [Dehalogenimonas etheniformans]QNT76279.1 phosphoglycerate kinase [Dehalogenimonas etheniformans]